MDEQSQIFISDGAGEEGGWGGENEVGEERWGGGGGGRNKNLGSSPTWFDQLFFQSQIRQSV